MHQGTDLDTIVDRMIAHMKMQIENPALLNSRFRFDEVLFLDANFYWLNLTRGSSYLPLLEWLLKKKVIIDPQNEDEECFKWTEIEILAGRVYVRWPTTVTALKWTDIESHPEFVPNLRKFTDNYDWSGFKFPVTIKDISMFENKNNVSVNVLVVEDRDIYIFRKGQRAMQESNHEIDLLRITKGGSHCGALERRWHYTVIKSLSRLLASKNSRHKCKQHFCRNCLQGFQLEKSRDEHYGYCNDN